MCLLTPSGQPRLSDYINANYIEVVYGSSAICRVDVQYYSISTHIMHIPLCISQSVFLCEQGYNKQKEYIATQGKLFRVE